MHPQRIRNLQALMSRDRVDGVLYADSANLQYFLDDRSYFWQRTTTTGFGRRADERSPADHFTANPTRILWVPVEGEPVVFVLHALAATMERCGAQVVPTHYALLGDALAPYLHGLQRVAVGESCQAALKALVGAADSSIGTPDGERYGEGLRAIKDADEIARLRSVAAFTDQAMGRITKALVPGVTPRQVKELIGQIALESGCADLSFDPGVIYVQAGAPSAQVLFSCPDDTPLREGTAVGFDFGFVRDGYCSDYGRSFYLGRSPAIRDAYKALMEAQLDMLSRIKPGVSLSVCYDTQYKFLEPLGWANRLRRSTHDLMGHQIGIDVHERPWLRGDEDTAVFQPGMVFCLEPKIWWPGHCYLRCEDMVLVTETGCESLTTYDREHFEL